MLLLVTFLLIALAASFLCSLLEAVLLSVPPSHVGVLVERGTVTGRRLQRMKNDIDQPLAAILTLNTFAHTLGAAGVGAEAALLWGDTWVGVVSFIVTLLILIFSEIIPKTLGAVHCKALAPFAAWVIHILIIVLRPVVAVCNWISLLISGRRQEVPRISRDEISSLAQMAFDEGVLDRLEAAILRNLIALRDVAVERVMTPRTVMHTLRAEQTIAEITAGEPPRFARIPVIGASLDEVVGVVHRHDLYAARAEGRGDTPLRDLARPIHIVPESARLPAVLSEFLHRRAHLFLVVDEYGGTAGIITLEDVLETLLGAEIMDETDAVPDMRRLAHDLLSDRRRTEH